jgi:Ca2+-binding RTX toxin-like protein
MEGVMPGKALGHDKNGKNPPPEPNPADVVGTDGNDFLDYSTSTEGLWIDGGLGQDTILGGSGDDILQGGRNGDYLDGGEGNDTYLYKQGDHADWIVDTGTGDWDVIEIAPNSTMYVNAIEGIEEITSDGTSGITGYVLDDTLDFSGTELNGIAWIGGGAGNDTITGNDDANTIYGNHGDDVIFGNGGDDIIIGGPGADTLTGGAGSDTFIVGQAGDGGDTIADFEAGIDTLDLSGIYHTEEVIVDQVGADAVVTYTSGAVTQTVTLQDADAAAVGADIII